MSKPEAIPQELYDRAWGLAGGCVERPYNQKPRHRTAMVIVRAILAAKAEERDEIAEMVDVFADTADFSAMNAESETEIVAFRIEEGALRGTAAAIRKRGEG